jgi:hypothetical protein
VLLAISALVAIALFGAYMRLYRRGQGFTLRSFAVWLGFGTAAVISVWELAGPGRWPVWALPLASAIAALYYFWMYGITRPPRY